MSLKDILYYPINLFNSLFPSPRYMTEERKKDVARKVISRQMHQDRGDCDCHGCGTESRLLKGRYITAEDAERMREAALR